MPEFITLLWDLILIQPITNIVVVMYALLGHNFVLALLAATVTITLATWPLTMRSLRSSKKMQELQNSEEWKAMQKKYKGDRERIAQETMRLYREAGVSPLGGCLPTFLQMFPLIAFYNAINLLLGANPESLLDLTRHLYRGIPFIAEIAKQAIPLQSQFLWLNLSQPDPIYVMPVLVAASTWLSQRTMATPSADPQAAAMANQMQIMMPIMFGFFTLSFPSGLAIYWVLSSVVRMGIQGFTQGWNSVLPNFRLPNFQWPLRTARRPQPRRPAEPPKPALPAATSTPMAEPPVQTAKVKSAAPAQGNTGTASRRRQRRRSRR